jgi:hypothetical protein
MSEITKLRDQLRRSHQGPAWHGPSLEELLADVTAAKAFAKPVPEAHSIWEVVLHVTAWQRVVVRRLAGEVILDLSDSENFPAVADPSEQKWQEAKTKLASARQELDNAIAQLPETRLNEIVAGKGYSVYFMLHGVVQHNLYHAGQIALLKKM